MKLESQRQRYSTPDKASGRNETEQAEVGQKRTEQDKEKVDEYFYDMDRQLTKIYVRYFHVLDKERVNELHNVVVSEDLSKAYYHIYIRLMACKDYLHLARKLSISREAARKRGERAKQAVCECFEERVKRNHAHSEKE